MDPIWSAEHGSRHQGSTVRGAREETGLIMSNVVGEIPPLEYSAENILAAEECSPKCQLP